MAKSEGSMSEDIVIEILPKLPVKSLLRFNPGFISKHQENEHNTRLVVRYLADDEDDPHEEHLYIKQEIGLWNFATRDYKILPKIKPDSFWTIYGVGLGMDQKSNCSKLVCAMAIAEYDHNDVLKSSDSNQVAIYSFDTNSWRDFQSLELSKYKFEVGDTSKGRYQNGACYWPVKPRFEIKHPDYKVILSFDLSNEVFQEIQPIDCRYESPIHWPYKALGESHNYNWTRQFTVTAPFIANDEELEVYKVLGFWKNGAFLFAITDEGRIFLYDPTAEQKFKDLQLDDDITTATIYLYKESLLNVTGKGLFALLC
ncbi:F-box/kelch-repeat protein [Citrus sinensis]|uniref:F-box/kelch-repeat protein n=1 Tax=Citrus sinensis TaxID=2711 RepID=A0ACB8MBL1_CITSI|nr:F-box/kelch-repeat protein [Citrus sinensis]